MKTKFIGIDGYGEIESVPSLKNRKNRKSFSKLIKVTRAALSETVAERREAKNAPKPTRLERYYAERRREGSERLSTQAVKLSKLHLAKSKARRAAQRAKVASPYILKSKVALGLATSLVAVMLCFSVPMASFSATSAPKTVQAKKSAAKKTELTKKVNTEISKSMGDDMLTDGYGLYIDGAFTGVSLDEDALKDELQKVLDDYKAKYDDETTDEFASNVEIIYGAYKSADVAESKDLVEKSRDKLSISLSTDIVYTQKVPFTTTVKYDNTKYTGYSRVTQKGISGKQKITYRVTYVDGTQTDAIATKIKTIKKVQNKIVVKGTKKKAVVSASSNATSYVSAGGSTTASGSFMWPLPYTHNLTSGFGARWGRFHSGIDISAGGVYGKPIVASDSGTVEWAGYDNSGYGNYVIINHGNGYKTLYGHCSSVYVSRGQRVSKGSAIAAVGSTGDSTGPHLHFEVRTAGGSRLNPLGFVH